MSQEHQSLDDVRQKIDDIDCAIQDLVVRRAEIVKDVGRIKRTEKNAVFYRPEREANVLKKVMQRNCGELEPKSMAKIFREIMSVCLAYQHPLKVAFLGPKGTFSEVATQKQFGSAIDEIYCNSIFEIFSNVSKGTASYGVVPIENSIGGLVDAALNEFIDSDLTICAEVTLKIEQALLAKDSDAPIQKIYSHQQSLLQCREWLNKHYPDVERIALSSNAAAAKRAAAEENCAAIAGTQCAKLYNLKLLAQNIADHKNNQTRFLVVGHQPPQSNGDDRTTILVKVHDAPGALEKLINPFANNGINITMIRSKPALENLSAYYFFLDLDCYHTHAKFNEAMQQIENNPAMQAKILGSYPKAVI